MQAVPAKHENWFGPEVAAAWGQCQAQLALATGMRVLVQVTDEKMHDGFCLATRITVLSE